MNQKGPAVTQVSINPNTWIWGIFVACVSMQFLLILADYVLNYMDVFGDINMRRMWNIAREGSIPTWFSSAQAHMLGATVLLIAVVKAANSSRLITFIWIGIGLFFLWIGIDDVAEIHERLGAAIRNKLEDISGAESNIPSFAWQAFLAPVFAAIGLFIALFLWREFWRKRLVHYLIFGFGLWVVAQIIDYLEGIESIDIYYLLIQDMLQVERKYFVTHTMKVIEEEMEMLGTTVLWVGFLHYLAAISGGLHFTFNKDSKSS